MRCSSNNYAFIDGQNLYITIKKLGWKIDWSKFRIYLKEKYSVSKAFLFLGYIPSYKSLYQELEGYGYEIIFKPVVKVGARIKGNCDAELVLQALIEINNYHQAVIVSGDGDFQCLIKYLLHVNKLKVILVPDRHAYSALLKFSIFKMYLRFCNDLKDKVGK